jgi:Methyltransferase domain
MSCLEMPRSPAPDFRALAVERGVRVDFELADVHKWKYPEAAFNVVVEIFTQFSSPDERRLKWAGMRRALKPGGLLIIQGYTPKQLEYDTGGPKQLENLYTREVLKETFSDFRDLLSALSHSCSFDQRRRP